MKILKVLAGINFLLCFAISGASAQSISLFGMTISGKTISDGSIYISYTLGEVFSGAINGKESAVIGILQPENVVITSLFDTEKKASLVNFYPNPTLDVLNISDPEGKVYNIVVCNMFGVPVLSSPMSGAVNMEPLTSGMYTIQLLDENNNCIYSSKVSKL